MCENTSISFDFHPVRILPMRTSAPVHQSKVWAGPLLSTGGLCYAEMANLAPSSGSSYSFVYHSAGSSSELG